MIAETVTPASVAETCALMEQFFRPASALPILVREPSVLYRHPADVRACIDALVDALGADEAREAVECNPTLLQPNRGTHIRGCLDTLTGLLRGDAQAARKCCARNTLLMGTPRRTMVGAHRVLCDLLTPDGAHAMVLRTPGVLRSLARTIRGAWEVLRELFGAEAALALVVRNSSMLKCPAHKLRANYDALVDMLGRDAAASVLARQPGLLRTRAATLHESFATLASALGPARARDALLARPVLLQIRPVVLSYNMAALTAFGGPGGAGAALAVQVPLAAGLRLGDVDAKLQALAAVFGGQQAATEVLLRSCALAHALLVVRRARRRLGFCPSPPHRLQRHSFRSPAPAETEAG